VITETPVVKILVVDDHPLIRLGLRSVIDAEPDLHVVAEANSARTALAAAAESRPDLVVLPLRLEGELKGVELCRELVAMPAAPRVMIYTSYNSAEDASASFLSGANSFVHKGEEAGRLVETIRDTMAGRRIWLLGTEPRESMDRLERVVQGSNLTPREQEVLALMLKRLSNAQIATTLFVELPTVKTHVSNILAKLGVRSRRELF
jgi:two-component system response regulator DevR